ncbi:hypothetical protein [Cerasicoccus fimbriatus]|uniref:hypothetical protein n=1 Tax=Cerasicoccus fimbriatus TaxID=3014554 RepID=UPI0022B2BE37|nr:hypothetical protein [Cerasicoccus sp. TK19100]
MSKRFLPSIDQIKRASEELPDADSHESEECAVSFKVGSTTRELSFKRVKFNAGEGKSIYRWVYDGKVMIRNSDIQKSRQKEKDDDSVIFSVSVR